MRFILPPPSAIGSTLWEQHDRFLFNGAITFKEMVWGIAIAFAVSFPLAWAMYLKRFARDILNPLFVLVQCVPMFTLAPIMVVWFGWSELSIIIPTALMIFFPLTMNIYQGLKSTPQDLIDYFRVHHATPWQLFIKLQLPWSLPHIFAGLRIATAIAGVGAIAGEWAGAQHGLGLLMLESRRSADLETSFAALFSLALLSLGMYSFIILVEKTVMERKRKKRVTTAIAALSIIIGLIFCSIEAMPEKQQSTTLVLDWLPNPDHVPLYVGIQKGIFKKHGVDLVIKKVPDPSNPISYVTSGQADLAIFYGLSTVRAVHRGQPIEPVALLVDQPLQGLIYRSGEGIEHPKDLSGKIAGYCVDGSNTAFLDTILRLNEIKPKEKRNVNFDLVSTLGVKQVDYIYGGFWNIECEHLRAMGIETECFTFGELGVPNYPELVIVAHKERVGMDPAFVESVRTGLQEAIDYCRNNPDEAFDVYIQCNPDKSKKVVDVERKAWATTLSLFAKSQEIDQPMWKTFKQWLTDNGIIE